MWIIWFIRTILFFLLLEGKENLFTAGIDHLRCALCRCALQQKGAAPCTWCAPSAATRRLARRRAPLLPAVACMRRMRGRACVSPPLVSDHSLPLFPTVSHINHKDIIMLCRAAVILLCYHCPCASLPPPDPQLAHKRGGRDSAQEDPASFVSWMCR